MFKKLLNAIWPATPPIEQSRLAARVDATSVTPQITDAVTQAPAPAPVSPQAEQIKKAVAKNAKSTNKPVVPKTAAEKKKSKKAVK
jgi:hypothetical protein